MDVAAQIGEGTKCLMTKLFLGLLWRASGQNPRDFWNKFSDSGYSEAAAIRQEIAPQTISTKDVYQSKHMVGAQIGEAWRAQRPAKQILIQLTILGT